MGALPLATCAGLRPPGPPAPAAVGHRTVGLDQPAAWHAALAGLPHGFALTHGWARAMAAASGQEPRLHLLEGPRGRAAVVLAERRLHGVVDLVTPYGYGGFACAGDMGGLAAAWRHAAAPAVAAYVYCHPLFVDAAVAPADDAFDAGNAWIVDLAGDEAALFAGLARDHRQRLRQWLRSGFAIIDDRARLAPAFRRLYADFVERIDAAPLYRFPDAALDRLLAHPGLVALGVEGPGGIEAVSLFGATPWCGEYLLSASTPDGRRHARGLVWHAMRRLKAAGVPRLNLGGGIRRDDDLAAFKARFGAVRHTVPCFKQVFDAGRFAAACASAGVPASRDGYFPPWWQPAAGGGGTGAR